jgi:anti-sigma factor RsiW
MDKRLLRLLVRSLEGPLKKRDRHRLDRALSESEELRRARDKIEAMRGDLAAGAARSFRPGFPGRVLAKIEADRSELDPQTDHYRRFQAVFPGFALACCLVLAFLITYNLAHGELVPRNELLYACDQTVGEFLSLPIF